MVVSSINLHHWLLLNISFQARVGEATTWPSLFANLVYQVWIQRNKVVFQGERFCDNPCHCAKPVCGLVFGGGQ